MATSQPQDYLLLFTAEDDLDRVPEEHNLQSKCHEHPFLLHRRDESPRSMGAFHLKPVLLRCDNLALSSLWQKRVNAAYAREFSVAFVVVEFCKGL